jgi:hypothetical protein
LAGVEMEELGNVVDDVGWFVWDTLEPSVGWTLRLAVEDLDNDCAWAVEATDSSFIR